MYFLFAGENYYPEGGCHDLIFDSPKRPEEIVDYLKSERGKRHVWWEIALVDSTGIVVLADDEGNKGTLEEFIKECCD